MSMEYELKYTAQEIDEKLGQISTPDWEQNDPQGEGYVKNRPFYSEGSVITFEPTTDATIIGSAFELIAGQSYGFSFTLKDGSIISQTLVAETFNEMTDANIPNGDKIICLVSNTDNNEHFMLFNDCGVVDGEPAYVKGSAVYSLTDCVSATLNIGKIKTIDPKYLPDYISKTETTNEIQKTANEIQDEVANKIQNEVNKVKSEIKDEILQSDFEENDSTSKAYIQNRPFYSTKSTETETLYNTMEGSPLISYIEVEGLNSIQCVLMTDTKLDTQFSEGAKLSYALQIVDTLTGTDTVKKYSDNIFYIGNPFWIEEDPTRTTTDTSVPWAKVFCIAYNKTNGKVIIYIDKSRYSATSNKNISLSSTYTIENIKQLDPKYIPDYVSKTEVSELINSAIQEALYVDEEELV